MKVVIVGGVAGGASAAARIRRLDEHAQIIMIERSGYVSYANCGLPYYVGGVIKEQEELTLQTPESFWDRFRIKKSIFKIHYQEMMLFIILIVIFPIVMYGSLLYQSYLVNMITYNTFITMIAIYIILYTFMSIYMIVSYRKLIKEVYDDVRYLNHGE